MSRAWAIIAGLCTLAAACSSGPPTRFFTLTPVPSSGGASAYAGPPVKVADVRVPPSMDRLELVRQSAGPELVVDDFAHWAAAPGDLARTALTEDLAARLPAGRVIYPDMAEPDGTLRLSVELIAFTCAPGTASIDASWTLAARSKAAGVPHPLHLSGGCGADSASEAAALSTLLGRLADAVAADLDLKPVR